MELKDYQQRVITDLNDYLTILEETKLLDVAFQQYWAEKSVTDITPYKNNVANVPHVCIKVPTAGGKTFIAVNAIKAIFDCFAKTNPKQPQFVVWLVPSLTILEQTAKALANPDHPYRKQLNIDFRHRVAVYQKHDLLMAADFSLDTAQEQLSIVVMSFDSLRAKNKEDRKIYQDNGYLASFLTADNNQDYLLDGYDASALINVMRRLKPVIIVDESHNAETPLSVEMLKNLNPNLILDLTATPKNNSNIISYVDAMQLKKQHMVKLPVIVSNHADKHKVIEEALILRQQLENIAIQQQSEGGKYIRPIILFQAQAKTNDDNTTFEKIKEFLISVNVPAEQIKIKTAQINELKNIDLLSPECPVRYIITVNALKEGWDCPFSYILASLADKSSPVDVEQILGRVLRMPHVQQHGHDLLNMSYVLTASSRFLDTLQSIIKALNKAGFSDKDYRQALPIVEPLVAQKPQQPDFNFEAIEQALDIIDDLDNQKIATDWQNITIPVEHELVEGLDNGSTGSPLTDNTLNTALASVSQLMQQAISQNQQYQEVANHLEDSYLPAELEAKVNKYAMKEMFRDDALNLKLPQFVMPTPNGGFLSSERQLVERDWLLKDFKLANLDAQINFDHIDTEMYQVDLEQVGNNDYAPKPFKMDYAVREKFNKYILSLDQSGQIFNLTARLFQLIGNLYPIDDNDAKTYIGRIVAQMSVEQINDCLERDMAYVRKIKQKINVLQDAHAYQSFTNWLDIEKITVEPMFSFSPIITPKGKAPDIAKSLYLTEDSINNFEHRIINDIAQLDNIVWWHRNLSKGKGFCINGAFTNHYPDFIVKTQAGRILIIETKGDDRDNSDSANKLKLGKEWANKAGSQYRYMMIFENKPIEGAERLPDALSKIEQL